MNIEKIKLQKVDGRYVLSAVATKAIKQADEIMLSYNKGVPAQCYMMCRKETKIYGQDFDMSWIMPINVLEEKYRIAVTIHNNSKHPIQELLKKGDIILFLPSQEGLLDSVRFMIKRENKTITGIFEQRIARSENSPIRIVSL